MGILLATSVVAQTPAQRDADADSSQQGSLAERQERLKNNFTRLEQKLLDLYEYELSENPERSELLKDAFQLSQDRRIALQLDSIVSRLQSQEYKSALAGQRAALEELKALLQLLQNEDQSERLQEEQKRIKAYLVEVERLLRIQQGLRGQAEGGVDPARLSDSQGKTADRAGQLAQKLRENEGTNAPTEDADLTQESTPETSGEDQPSLNPNQDEQPAAQDQKPPVEGDPAAQPPQQGQPPNPQAEPKPPGAGQGEAPPQQSTPEGKVQERVEAAQKRMREAQQRLEQAQQDESVDEMRAAEAELAKAKEQLEQILRQLREKEIERTLGMLETRFREMLKQEQEIVGRTERLDQIESSRRGAEFHIEAGKLSTTQMNVALEADRLLMILLEEGSAIAFPQTVMQVRDDMEEVAARLRDSKVDPLTLALEEDIVQGLQDILDALVAAQQENQDEKQKKTDVDGSPRSQPGEAPLVNQIEELKLIRNLQERILQRHQRYSRLIERPDDPIGYTSDPELQRALDQLSDRQNQLHKITRDVIDNKQ